MNRVVVVTGSASGIGRATAERFRSRGHRVIGVDLRDADVIADLASVQGRSQMLRDIEALAPEGLDTVIAAAGIAGAADPGRIIAVNYFGALATLEGLRPLLAKSTRPRAVAVVSTAAVPELINVNTELADACLAGDEKAALACAAGTGDDAYPASKHALGRWLRLAAVCSEWAGTGILLNGVAPGCVLTPMTAPFLASEEGRAMLAKTTPIAVREYGRPEELAEVLEFLGSIEGRYLVGQIVFVDGGSDAIARPTRV